jgi:hypothetical protein
MAKQRAEAHLGQAITRIVLGRPVRFAFDARDDQLARERLLRAAFMAGYEEVYLQYEPIAAAYHYERQIDREQHVMIFDFGGGTLDVSVVRIGDPRRRAVLANGGVPIAGDVFDQKIVRARLPKHFGEGTHFRKEDQSLPVPSSFYEAFSSWQEMLTLQRPETLEYIRRIETSAEKPLKIRALRQLVSSSYGLKMYDVVEQSKRQLSDHERVTIRLEGNGFQVAEPLARFEFERIIRPEITQIDAYLDEMLDQAALRADDIDVVIRTGGSSEIPAFIHMLHRKFGAEKVRSLDIFSSVTSGLGIIAHQISTGQIDAEVYRAADFPLPERAQTKGVKTVDFETIKKYIAFGQEKTFTADYDPGSRRVVEAAVNGRSDAADTGSTAIVGLMGERGVFAYIPQPEPARNDQRQTGTIAALPAGTVRVLAAPAAEPLILYTTDYNFVLKTPRQLARLEALGLDLADAEGFKPDVFGDEHVCSATRWSDLAEGCPAALITTTGHVKRFQETLLARLEQPVPYRMPRMKGLPLALISLCDGAEIVVFSEMGRGLRVPAQQITSDARLINISGKDRLLAAFRVAPGDDRAFLIAGETGLTRLTLGDIPLSTTMNSAGERVTTRRPVAVLQDSARVTIFTTQRTLIHEAGHDLRLKKNERITGAVGL